MRIRSVRHLRCPSCKSQLNLHVLAKSDIPLDADQAARVRSMGGDNADFTTEVGEGFLLCDACKVMYPVHDNVARLFIYTLNASGAFIERSREIVSTFQSRGYRLPDGRPEPGEGHVQSSFSKEWGEYEYDGLIWAWTNEGRLDLCLRELGMSREELRGKLFADIGSGNGVLTNMVSTAGGAETVGLDVSFAAVQAARQFRSNPFVTFVQGSAYHVPLAPRTFDIGYSSGVLHHSWGTRLAFENVVKIVKPGGVFYIWLYSSERHGMQGVISKVNNAIRGIVARLPFGLQDVVLKGVLTPVFWGTRAVFRSAVLGGRTTPYNWKQALHAARDAYTPLFAHHHSRAEVTEWFRQAGFQNIEALVGEKLPKSKSIPCSVRGRAA